MTRDPTTLAEGDVALRADLHLPIRRGLTLPDIRYDVIGELTDMRSDTLVPDRVLSAETLDLRVVPDRIEIGGRAMLDSVPATATWSRALGPDAPRDGLVEGRATLSARALDDLGIVLPPGMVSGRGPAEFTLQLPPDGPPRLAVASDLNGIGIDIAGLGWQLSPRQTGRLEMDVVLGPTPSVPAISLTARDLSMTGAISLAPGGGMDRFDIDRFTVTPWLDVNGALIGRGQGRAPRIEVLGGTADLARAPAINTDAGREDGVPGGGPLQISLDRLRVSEGIDLTDLRADLDLGGGLSGQFRGLVNGQAPLSGSLIPTGTGPAVRMTSDDGGAVLRAASVFSDGYGGDMVLVLQPTGERGTYDGRMTIDSPRLRDAPAMAELLNLVSVVGMIEQLTGEGINLGEVEARFRLTPRAITIAEGSALGPSMGISMDGLYDIAARRYDMQGVISPFYLINGLIGAIFSPRREGLFGFSYRLTGGPGETSVSVNPLSILTPGIFREIFRRPPPQVTQ